MLQSRFVQVLSLASARRTTRPPSGTLTRQEIGAETLKPDQGCAGPSISSMSSPLRLHKGYKKGLSYPLDAGTVRDQPSLSYHLCPRVFVKMHLKYLFGLLPLFVAAAALADGYIVPNVIAPGFYVVNFHEDGNTTTERVGVDAAPQTVNLPEKRDLTFTSSSTKYARQLTKRATFGGTGRVMAEQAQYNSLTQAWRNYLGGGNTLEGRHIWYFTSDRLVLALCAYGCEFPIKASASLASTDTDGSLHLCF